MQLDISYHNTNGLQGEELAKANDKARSLEDKVLQMLYTTHKTGLTKSDLKKHFGNEYGESSYGRALTNLTYRTLNRKFGRVVKTKVLSKGIEGQWNHVYKLIL